MPFDRLPPHIRLVCDPAGLWAASALLLRGRPPGRSNSTRKHGQMVLVALNMGVVIIAEGSLAPWAPASRRRCLPGACQPAASRRGGLGRFLGASAPTVLDRVEPVVAAGRKVIVAPSYSLHDAVAGRASVGRADGCVLALRTGRKTVADQVSFKSHGRSTHLLRLALTAADGSEERVNIKSQ